MDRAGRVDWERMEPRFAAWVAEAPGEWQRIDDVVSRPTDETGGGDSIAHPGMAGNLTPTSERVVWGRILGAYAGEGAGLALYEFELIIHDGNEAVTVSDGYGGTTRMGVALETNDNLAVPEGAVVPVWASEDSLDGAGAEKWRFFYPPAAPAGETCVDQLIGDSVTNPIVVAHATGTASLMVEVMEVATGEVVYPTVTVTTTTITIAFTTTPTANQYRLLYCAVGGGAATIGYTVDVTITAGPGVTVTYTGGTWEWSGAVIVYAAVTVNLTQSQTWTVYAGETWTIVGPGFLVFSINTKFHEGWWLAHRNVDFSGIPRVDDLDLPADATDRVVVCIALDQDTVLTGMVPTEDGGAGQVIWLANTSGLYTLTLAESSAFSAPENVFVLPGADDLVIGPQGGALCWYDPESLVWRVIGFCCGTDRVKVSADDTTAGYLQQKLVAGTGILFTLNNPGANETLTIATTVDLSAPKWVKVATKTFADFTAASNTINIEAYSLPAKGVIHGAVIKHPAAFTGGAVTACTISLGYSSAPTEFTPALNVFAAPSGTAFAWTAQDNRVPKPLDFTAATSIRLYATSGGANLSALTAGSIEVWLCLATLP